jgi:hypothetical protein
MSRLSPTAEKALMPMIERPDGQETKELYALNFQRKKLFVLWIETLTSSKTTCSKRKDAQPSLGSVISNPLRIREREVRSLFQQDIRVGALWNHGNIRFKRKEFIRLLVESAAAVPDD